MPFDGSGNFNRVMNWVSDALANIKIVATRHDSEDDNFAAGLSQCITKDGQTQPTANIPMNSKKLINLGAPTVGTDATTKTYVDTADALLAPKASPALTGVPTAPTAAPGTNTTQIATTAYADAIAALKANLASPTFTGTPAAPTAAPGTNTTQLSTTAFVTAAISAAISALSSVYQPLSAVLTALAGIGTAVAGDIIYSTGAGAWGRRAKGTALQALLMNSGATAPVWTTVPFTQAFESAQQTIASAGLTTVAHGLGVKPKLYAAYVVCLTAEGGFSIGMEVPLTVSSNSASQNQSNTIVADATNLSIRLGNNGSPVQLNRFDTGANFGITNANWRLIARAWA